MQASFVDNLHGVVDGTVLLGIVTAIIKFSKMEEKVSHLHDCLHEFKENVNQFKLDFKETTMDVAVLKHWMETNLERRTKERNA